MSDETVVFTNVVFDACCNILYTSTSDQQKNRLSLIKECTGIQNMSYIFLYEQSWNLETLTSYQQIIFHCIDTQIYKLFQSYFSKNKNIF